MMGGRGRREAAAPDAQGLVRLETTQTPLAFYAVSAYPVHSRRTARLRRTILTAGRLMVDCWRGSRAQWWMVTLTYAPDAEWKAGQISECTNRYRQWCARNRYRCSYVWVLETTKAGRPHYHLLVQVPHRVNVPHFDTRGWWSHGLTRTERAKRPVGYVAKYASKAGSAVEQFHGARSYGVCGLLPRDRAVLSFWRAPRWVREAFGFCHASGSLPETDVDQPVRRVRGGWSWAQTGELIVSPWLAIWSRSGLNFYLKSDIRFASTGANG